MAAQLGRDDEKTVGFICGSRAKYELEVKLRMEAELLSARRWKAGSGAKELAEGLGAGEVTEPQCRITQEPPLPQQREP
jgi:hypothetical protein